jgi:surface protein
MESYVESRTPSLSPVLNSPQKSRFTKIVQNIKSSVINAKNETKNVMNLLQYDHDDEENFDGNRYRPVNKTNLRYALLGYFQNKDQSYGNINTWDVSYVTDMSRLFEGMLIPNNYLDLSGWDVSKCKDMSCMFQDCRVGEINLTGWSFETVKTMYLMFNGCFMQTLRLNEWNTKKVTNMTGMFRGCKYLKNLNVRKLDVSNVIEMMSMFHGCQKLTQLNLNSWDVSNVISMNHMFGECKLLETLNVSRWDVSKVYDMGYMFFNCNKLHNIRMNTWKTKDLTLCHMMFSGCHLFNSPLNRWETAKVVDMRSMFENCRSFNQSLIDWDTTELRYNDKIFDGCIRLEFTNSNLREGITNHVENTGLAFQVHNLFENIDISKFLSAIGFTIRMEPSVILNSYTPTHNEFDFEFEFDHLDDDPVTHQTYGFDDIRSDLVSWLRGMVNLANDNKTTMQFHSLVESSKFENMFKDYYLKPIHENSNITIGDVIESVKAFVTNRTDDKFKINYIKCYLQENMTAYPESSKNPEACISCGKGIMERLVLCLSNGGFDSDKKLYKDIAKIVMGKVSQTTINSLGMACLKEEHGNKIEKLTTLKARKHYLKKCIMKKLVRAKRVLDEKDVPSYLPKFIKAVEQDFLAGGGKKRTKRRR